jgi:hypothetical protein
MPGRPVPGQGGEPVLPSGFIGHGPRCALPVRQHGQPVTEGRRECAGRGVAAAPLQPGRQRPLGPVPGRAGGIPSRFLDHGHELMHPRQAVRAHLGRCLPAAAFSCTACRPGPQPAPRTGGSRPSRPAPGSARRSGSGSARPGTSAPTPRSEPQYAAWSTRHHPAIPTAPASYRPGPHPPAVRAGARRGCLSAGAGVHGGRTGPGARTCRLCP